MATRKAPERAPETRSLERELRTLLAETNDLRRRTGQALWHLDRTLVFWERKGRGFLEIVRLWLPAAAAVFESTARSLREHGEVAPDRRLRRFVAGVLLRLADEVGRGDVRLHPFLRWLEGRFPALTEMMKAERPGSRVYDAALAQTLADALLLAGSDDRPALVARLRAAAEDLAGGGEDRERR